MGQSNDGWMESASSDAGAFDILDLSRELPQPGENEAFDALLSAKNITRRALARTGARLGREADNVLLWCQGKDSIKFRRFGEYGKLKEHETTKGAHFDTAHIMVPRDRDAPQRGTLLIPGGQTDAARVWELYPQCAVAVLLGGEGPVPDKLPALAARYARVYVCTDADEAGDAAAERLMEAIPGSIRHRPPASDGDNDWCGIGLDAEVPPLPGPPTLPLLDIAARAHEPLPQMLVPNLLPEGTVVWLGGHPGEGKTTMALWCALTFIRMGRPVLWLDWEGGPRQTAARFADLGATDEEIRKLRYADAPHISADAAGQALLLNTVQRVGDGALVVYDSCSKSLASNGLEENNNSEVTQWTVNLLAPLRERCTVLVLDHVAKEATRATPYPRGAGAKKADTDIEFYLEAAAPFNRETVGRLRLTRHKDRLGLVPHTIYYSIGDGKGGIPITETSVVKDDQSGVETTKRILDLLDENEENGLTINQIETRLQDKSGAVARILNGLADDAASGVICEFTPMSLKFKKRGGPAPDTDAF